jgi:helicase
MKLNELAQKLPAQVIAVIENEKISSLRPAQEKAINAGLFESKNLLVCTPTASGKTLVAELAIAKTILEQKAKAVYVVPLVSLASEKFKDFKRKYSHLFKTALSAGDLDSNDAYLASYDLIICTAEKLDSITRHSAPWLSQVKLAIIDEIHLLNDPGRGPTLEILITLLRKLLPKIQLIGLSATIGNPEELAGWLSAELVQDTWRPVELKKGIFFDSKIEFE